MSSNETPEAAEVPPKDDVLFVKDIEFRAEVIYFIVVDRFADGDPSNNEGQDPSLYDPTRTDWGKYWGGDLQGIIDKLDYLRELGITALWLTPLFEQIETMVWDQAPIHGYWTRDFKRINSRWVRGPDESRVFASNETTFDRLIEQMHARDMKFILDIVCNHSSPDANGVKGQLFDDGKLIADFNDDKDHWYHHYGPVQNWNDTWQVQNCELAGLATFNEHNVDYRRYVMSAMKAWVDKGVDALRVDTVKHMPLWFWQEFTSEMSSKKPDLFMFGEWIYSHPGNPAAVDFANHSGMSILDFGVCMAIRDALGHRSEAGFLEVESVFAMDANYRSATELVTFFDNHDMPRLLSIGADAASLRLATILILTARGIPCIYYGTEQQLHDDTNGGGDPYNRAMMQTFDTTVPLFRDIKALAALRRSNIAVQFGSQRTHYLTPDVYAYGRRHRDGRCFVVLNRGEATLLENVPTDLPDDEYTCLLSGRTVAVRDGSIAGLELGASDAIVLSRHGEPVGGEAVARFQVNGCGTAIGDTVAVIGDCPELGEWDTRKAVPLEYVNDNLWQADVPFVSSLGKPVAYKYIVLRNETDACPPRRENRTVRRRVIPNRDVVKWRDVWEH